VYQIVQAHEGKVWARSKLGQGSVFVLRLRRYAVGEALTAPRGTSEQDASAALVDSAGSTAAAAAGGARG
jgi:hypothetical protein